MSGKIAQIATNTSHLLLYEIMSLTRIVLTRDTFLHTLWFLREQAVLAAAERPGEARE
ncbi:hypothetical protein TUM17576_56070 [Enterobacter hormaechei]|jgi:hypothetical protein|nr:hypothetical protein TUM17576_56070 [Enterobacter hormaechei]